MRDTVPSFATRVARKLRGVGLYSPFRRYVAGIGPQHPLYGAKVRLVGDASADPTELFDHYDAFAVWAMRKIVGRGARLKLLDVGSVKMMNAMLSTMHDVTALVLADCQDSLSGVSYVRHDAALPLPFPDSAFDVFTSMVSLPLIGLGRYGDRLDPECLVRLVRELSRVMKPDADLLVSMCLGPTLLNFNNGWYMDMPAVRRVFAGWEVVDLVVDRWSSPRGHAIGAPRFSPDASVDAIALGDYRVALLHLRRNHAPARG
jgi:SAM-dependent methyltransferase